MDLNINYNTEKQSWESIRYGADGKRRLSIREFSRDELIELFAHYGIEFTLEQLIEKEIEAEGIE